MYVLYRFALHLTFVQPLTPFLFYKKSKFRASGTQAGTTHRIRDTKACKLNISFNQLLERRNVQRN